MKYKVRCLKCRKIYSEASYIIKCTNDCDALLRTEYFKKKLDFQNYNSLWKYLDWLPIKKIDQRILKYTSTFFSYKSKGLASFLNLKT